MRNKDTINTGNGKIESVRDEICKDGEFERIDSRT